MSEDGATYNHNRAMELADQADAALREGDEKRAACLYKEAAYYELEALAYARDNLSRAVLSRSAATLGLQGGGAARAESIVLKALAEDPPSDEMRAELRAVLRAAWKAQGITAKSDRAIADTFVMQRRGIRTALKRMEAKGDES